MNIPYFKNLLVFSVLCQTISAQVTFEAIPINEYTQKLMITFKLKDSELLYKDSLQFSVDSPSINLSSWQSNTDAINKYDEVTKDTHFVFEKNFTINMEAQEKNKEQDASLYVTYQTNRQPYPQQILFPIPLAKEQQNATNSEPKNYSASTPADISKKYQKPSVKSFLNNLFSYWSSTLSTLIKQTDSLPMRIILVFLLGMLLSLTPCIYPMIPITVGILQAQKSNSFISNFLHSFAYTLGISLTFACFGLMASYTGPIYGKLLMNPFSVGLLVLLLGYLGLSMFGLYDIQLPRFLQSKKQTKRNGSIFSSFFFGTASGTIASPCVSPGLILLLSIVASLGNILLGFILLFAFGLGLSTPLLLIGTFSSSLTLMPRAGLWMVEVKKLFGLMLFGVCFYYLSNVMTTTLLLYTATIFIAAIGIYYFWIAHTNHARNIKKYQNILGFIFLATSVITFTYSLTEQFMNSKINDSNASFWHTDYDEALAYAKKEQKLLFLDFWAEYCSVCKAINKKITADSSIVIALNKFVPVSINGTQDNQEPYHTLKEQYHIVGFPTFLVVDPQNGTVLKEWHSELYQMPNEDFIREINRLIKKITPS